MHVVDGQNTNTDIGGL